MNITVDAVTKEPRTFGGRTKWGVKPVGSSDWINLYCDFKPSRGQQFSVTVKESQGKNGVIYRDAEIIGPAGESPAQEQAPAPRDLPQAVKPVFTSPPQPSVISWLDWCMAIRRVWSVAADAGMPAAEGLAVVNTTMIALSNGKVGLPQAEGEELSEDDIKW